MLLPVLEHINVERLSLYKGNVEHPILPGINMIIGGNGVGKTTFVQTVLFTLLGNAGYQTVNSAGKNETVPVVPETFFKGRIKPEDESDAKATLKYSIGKTKIEITRLLFRPKIIRLKIAGKLIHADEASAYEEKYRAEIGKLMQFAQFEDFVYVAANLLVFDEARRPLIWDPESQNKVMRILFLSEFHVKLSGLSDKMTMLDTKARHKSETRKDIIKTIARWEESEKRPATESASQAELRKNRVEYAQIQEALEQIDGDLNQIQSKISTESKHIEELLTQADTLETEKISITKALQHAETKFYAGIYESLPPQYLLLLQTLANQGTCQVCGTSHPRLKDLGKKLKAEAKCLVCRSPVSYESNLGTTKKDDKLTDEINALHSALEAINDKQRACVQAQAIANHEIQTLQPRLNDLTKRKHRDETALLKLQVAIDQATAGNQNNNPWLEKQRTEITDLTQEIKDLYQERDKAKEKLKKLNTAYTEHLTTVNDTLTPLFSKFSSKFLGVPCELVISTKTKSGKPVTYMHPRFNDKERSNLHEVSESQRFFIDQAFRMALISLFSELNNHNETFFIVETPEGSLDLAYERNVAEMYLDFAKFNHSIVITSNLNSSNFLKGLYDQLGDNSKNA
ncbi:MAG: chromosome segregation ATPase-like protein, partial [Verrucomicrobia bacterium]|nr:chromosome segregation ATPase-like protein [Verrucomicrobiota bacterium]